MNRKLLNRKLHQTMLALTASAAVFALLLLAGSPPLPAPIPAPQSAEMLMLSLDAANAVDAASTTTDDTIGVPAADGAQRHLRRTRALLALPYFSFAQGLRHNRS